MKKTKATISLILIVSLITGTAYAWGQGKGRKFGRGFAGEDCPRYGQQIESNLTQEQQDQLADLRQQFIDDTYPIRSEKIAKAQDMKMLMQTSNPDRAKLIQLSDEIFNLDKKLRDRQIDFQLEVKKIAPELSSGRGLGFGKGPGMWSGARGFGKSQNQRMNSY